MTDEQQIAALREEIRQVGNMPRRFSERAPCPRGWAGGGVRVNSARIWRV